MGRLVALGAPGAAGVLTLGRLDIPDRTLGRGQLTHQLRPPVLQRAGALLRFLGGLAGRLQQSLTLGASMHNYPLTLLSRRADDVIGLPSGIGHQSLGVLLGFRSDK